MAIGVAAAQPAFFGDYIRMCREQSMTSSQWAYACAAYGELAETQGKTMMTIAVAQAIQKHAYEGLGEDERAVELEARMQLRRNAYWSAATMFDAETARVVFSSPTLFSAYLATVQAEGELAATRKIYADVQTILEQQPELACHTAQ